MKNFDADSYNAAIEAVRTSEYPMLQDAVYLDHAGSTLCSKSLIDSFAKEMTYTLYGNPHSLSWPSQLSTSRIEDVRSRLLDYFHADATQYDLIFVSNATAGVKLVVEALRSLPRGFRFAHHKACHTSVIGAREEAKGSVCLEDGDIDQWLEGRDPFDLDGTELPSATLIAYSAQSHLDGRRYPRTWSKDLRDRAREDVSRTYTLLDAAAFCATSRLDLSQPDSAADFTVLSLYKMFGFPDLGALIVRKEAESAFDGRKYFGGGTVDVVVTGKEQWHAPKSQALHDRLEDGTLPFHNIIAVDAALEAHKKLFGSMEEVSSHTSNLTRKMVEALKGLRHANGRRVCMLYTDTDKDEWSLGTGPAVSFNLQDSTGAWISLHEFEKLATLKKMYLRTGGVCSPGGIAEALSLQPWEVKRNFSAGFRCGSENDVIANKPTGVIRVSFAAMSTLSDITRFVGFLREFYVEALTPGAELGSLVPPGESKPSSLRVKRITVYPIKSCAGFEVSEGTRWDVRPEGLAWDREWCLLHKGSGQALSQKRYPRMALLKPSLDFEQGLLRVHFVGTVDGDPVLDLTIPLSDNPSLYELPASQLRSRVCGDTISTKMYGSAAVHEFFTTALGVPCVLVRFPPGGKGVQTRNSKLGREGFLPTAIPSPPDSDSDSDQQGQPGKLLLSNESPILMVHQASVNLLNKEIERNGGVGVSESAFRANIVVEGGSTEDDDCPEPYSEDSWQSVNINGQDFKSMGGCQRCQMVCVDQDTGEKRQEPFVTLAKTRRRGGKVYFGLHMRQEAQWEKEKEREYRYTAIGIGDDVSVTM